MENLGYYVLLLPFIFFIIFKLCSSRQTHKSPPSPRSLPIIGHLHLFKNSLHLSLASLSSHYGPVFSLRIGCRSFVVVSSPSAIEECFTKNDIVFANRPKSIAGDRLTYNYSAFAWSPYGDFWRILRRLSVVELFSSHSLQKSAQIREDVVSALIRALNRGCNNEGKKVDLNYLISAYSFNNMMKIIAGKWCVAEDDVWSEVGKEAVNQIRGIFFVTALSMGVCDLFPVLRWIGYKGVEKNLMLSHRKRDEFLQGLIDEIRGKNDVPEEKRKRNLMETLLSLQESEPEFYTEDVIKSILLIMIIAGTENPAKTVEWAMSLLLTHPEELHKLRQEIDNKVGHHRLIKDSDLANLPYLRCIVNETLRLFPPVPLLLPHYSSNNCIVGGYNIPRDTILLVNAWATHRDPNVWDEPNKFNPERFKTGEVENEGKFVPFGMGRRACPGAGMALRTVSLALGAFVQCFQWEQVSEHEDMDNNYNSRVMLQKAKPLEAVCFPQDQASDLLLQL